MTKLSNEAKEHIRSLLGSFPEKTKREENRLIIEDVKTRFNEAITSDDIYEIGRRATRLEEAIDELNRAVGSENAYEVVDNNYVFVQGLNRYTIPVQEIDEMFYSFSKHGANLTGEQMLEKYELKPEVWHMIKNRLRLYKDSNVISPYTAENTDEEELEEKVVDATHRHIDTLKQKMVRTHEKLYGEEAKRAMKVVANQEYALSNLRAFLEGYKPREFSFVPRLLSPDYPPLTIAMSDFHFGKKGTSDIVRRMSYIRDYILSQPNCDIQIISLGDLGEAFVEGGMHPGQETNMELTGFELMMFIVNVFERFLEDIYKSGKTIRFVGIGGNHDRLGKTHSEDQARTGALVIYELLKRGLSKTEIQVDILRNSVNAFDYGDTRFIIAHGDDGFSNKKPEDVLWKNGDNSKHNVILNGDKHNATLRETKGATWVQVPALAWQGDYDKRLDLHSASGFVAITPNEHNTVDVLFKRTF